LLLFFGAVFFSVIGMMQRSKTLGVAIACSAVGWLLQGCGEAPLVIVTTTPPPPQSLKAEVPLQSPPKSLSITSDGKWVAVGGSYAQLYDLTDFSNPHKVQEFLADATANRDFGATPVISADGTKISVQHVDSGTGLVDKVVTYALEKVGDTVTVDEIGHVNTPTSTSNIAMSDTADWLIIPQYEENNPVKVYSWDYQASSWHMTYDAPSQGIQLEGPAKEVSVAVSNFEHGRIAVSVPPTDLTEDYGGELVLANADGTQSEIHDRLVRRSIGKVALSQDGQFFASWGTLAGVYDLISERVCHTFQTASYGDAHTPFALSRTGGWFAEASVAGVTLFKIHTTHQSCTVSEEAHVNLLDTSAVAFGGDHWLVVTGKETTLPNGDPCVGGCEVLRVYSIADLVTPSSPIPDQRLPTRAAVDLNGDIKSMSMTQDGSWLATGGNFAALYDLTDLTNAHQVQGFLSTDGHHCQNSKSIDSVGVMPILSADGSLVAVPTCPSDFSEITQVKTYTISSTGETTSHGSVDTADGTTGIAMSDAGDWLAVPQTTEGNPVNLYHFDGSWVAEYNSPSEQLALVGPVGKVSVSLSNLESGTVAASVGPRGVGATSAGEVLLATIGSDPVEIQDLLVRDSLGSVVLSQDGQYLASWANWAGVYDVSGYFVCHTFQTATYSDIQIPFALSRTGGWFAEATVDGVTLYKIRSTSNSCTMTQEAHMPLTSVSVVAFGGKDWLAVSAQSDEECVGGCKALRIYNLNDLHFGLEAQKPLEMAV